MMILGLELLVKATVILAAGLIAAGLARRAQASVRHLILAATFGALIFLPLAVVALPNLDVRVPIAAASAVEPPDGVARSAGAASSTRIADGVRATDAGGARGRPGSALLASLSTSTVVLTIARLSWLGGSVFLIASLTLAVLRVGRLRRHGIPRPELRPLAQSLAADARVRLPIDILEHEAAAAPLTCGLWRPAVILPADA